MTSISTAIAAIFRDFINLTGASLERHFALIGLGVGSWFDRMGGPPVGVGAQVGSSIGPRSEHDPTFGKWLRLVQCPRCRTGVEHSEARVVYVRVPAIGRITFAGQFLVFGLGALLIGMLTIGMWLQREIRHMFIDRTAAVTALYADSFLAHHIQGLAESSVLDADTIAELDEHFLGTSLGDNFVTVKLWASDGTIAYSTDVGLIGRVYDIDSELERALAGEVVSQITDLSDPENEQERLVADSLIETYVPIFDETGKAMAVAEFYQTPDALLADIGSAQLRGWGILAIATAALYLALFGLVRRASRLIESQRVELEGNVSRLSNLLAQNQHLRERMRGAAAKATALNEQYLRRISADLHDGPAQDVALALLRMESLDGGEGCSTDPRDLQTVQSALESAMTDIRSIARGLRMPEIEKLSAADTVSRVIRDFERVAGTTVDVRLTGAPETAPLSVKITLYRILQESLANSFKHASGASPTVTVATRDDDLFLEISDDGPGFDADDPPRDGSLGLAGMRERVEVLGGRFEITSLPDQGTRVQVWLPLEGEEDD